MRQLYIGHVAETANKASERSRGRRTAQAPRKLTYTISSANAGGLHSRSDADIAPAYPCSALQKFRDLFRVGCGAGRCVESTNTWAARARGRGAAQSCRAHNFVAQVPGYCGVWSPGLHRGNLRGPSRFASQRGLRSVRQARGDSGDRSPPGPQDARFPAKGITVGTANAGGLHSRSDVSIAPAYPCSALPRLL